MVRNQAEGLRGIAPLIGCSTRTGFPEALMLPVSHFPRCPFPKGNLWLTLSTPSSKVTAAVESIS